jgi:predicted O-methyltransferase YrrM
MIESSQSLSFEESILPVQSINREYFDGSDESLIKALAHITCQFSASQNPSEEFNLQEAQGFTTELFASNPLSLRLLQMLIFLKKPKKVLEIGTFIGLSTMCMAKCLPEDGQIVTLEKFDYFCRIAEQNFQNNGLSDKIKIIEGDAFEELKKLQSEKFDFIFLDGNKEKYKEYFELLEPYLEDGGLFVVDDVLFHGDVLNEIPKTEKGRGVKDFLETVKSREDYIKILLPIRNGMMLMYKR